MSKPDEAFRQAWLALDEHSLLNNDKGVAEYWFAAGRGAERADAEAALAECERNLEWSGKLCESARTEVANLERKLAAARECRQDEDSDDRPQGWQDWCVTHSQSVWRCLAALTEVGEQPYREYNHT